MGSKKMDVDVTEEVEEIEVQDGADPAYQIDPGVLPNLAQSCHRLIGC